jgi:hypothetical protein
MKVQLVNVRLAFADVFKATDFNSDGNFKFRSQLLIPKDSPEAKKIADAITEAGKEKYKDKWDKVKERIKAADNLCLRDGDLKDYDGFEGQWALTATNKTRPTLVDKDRTPLVESDGKPYSGCYVNAIVDVYAYDKYGDQINCTLLGLQFAGDGDAFSGSRPASEDDFDDLSDGADADEVKGAALI